MKKRATTTSFSADITINYTANVSFSGPHSWFKDSDTGDFFDWDKKEKDVKRDSGRFIYTLDSDSGNFEALINWETDIPDAVNFEAQEHDYDY